MNYEHLTNMINMYVLEPMSYNEVQKSPIRSIYVYIYKKKLFFVVLQRYINNNKALNIKLFMFVNQHLKQIKTITKATDTI